MVQEPSRINPIPRDRGTKAAIRLIQQQSGALRSRRRSRRACSGHQQKREELDGRAVVISFVIAWRFAAFRVACLALVLRFTLLHCFAYFCLCCLVLRSALLSELRYATEGIWPLVI